MEDSKKLTIGALIVVVSALIVLGGLIYWALSGDEEIVVEGESIVSFALEEDMLLASSANLDSIEIRYIPAGDNQSEQVLGEMNLLGVDEDGIQEWSYDLSDEPILAQSVIAYGFVEGENVDRLELSADDLASFRLLWFEVPAQEMELAIGEEEKMNGITVSLIDVLEDSRCPQDVECVQAGQVRVQIEIKTSSDSRTFILSNTGEGVAFGDYFVEIISVSPEKKTEGQEISREEYSILFGVSQDIKL